MLKGKNSKKGAYTRDAGEMSIIVLTVIEEVGHSLEQILMVIGVWDKAFPGATDTFAVEQGGGGEATEYLDKDIIHEVG